MTAMQFQLLVGLCCLRRDPDAVDITIGDEVLDESTGTERDVDVTVTIKQADGSCDVISGYEVRNWTKPLSVNDIEGLITKMKDMPSLRNRLIVSASGYSETCNAKAAKHGVRLYDFKKWDTEVKADFPKMSLVGTPRQSILFTPSHLEWIGNTAFALNPGDPNRAFWQSIDLESRVLVNGQEAQTLRSLLDHAMKQIAHPYAIAGPPLPQPTTIPPDELPDGPDGPPIQVPITRAPYSEPVFVIVNGEQHQIHELEVRGTLQWMRVRGNADYHIMRAHDDPKDVFAGAMVAIAPNVPDMILAMLLSPSDAGMSIHSLQLAEKHQNAIRRLKLKGNTPIADNKRS